MKVLESKLVGMLDGKECEQAYRGTIQKTSSGLKVLAIEQEIKGKWYGVPSGWEIESLVEYFKSDTIYLDMGQKWCVVGMTKLLKEIAEIENIEEIVA